MNCPKCLAHVPENSQFCPTCGAAVSPDGEALQQPAGTAPTRPHPHHHGPPPVIAPLTHPRSRAFRILVALALLLAAAGGAWGVLRWRAAAAPAAATWPSPPRAGPGLPSGGLAHTCAITEAGSVLCWGSAEVGQLGDTSAVTAGAPCTVCSTAHFTQLDAGDDHTCARTAAGGVLCWGSNLFNQLGTRTGTECLTSRGRVPCASVPVDAPVDHVALVAAGADFSCALGTDSLVRCWGSNYRGQLGVVTTTPWQTAARVGGTDRYVMITAGRRHACGIVPDGTIRCWGSNTSGQLGTRARTRLCGPTRQTLEPCSPAPVVVASDLRFRDVAAGGAHTCAIAVDGQVLCWGANGSGQLGNATTEPAREPVPATGGRHYQAVAAGADFTCAIATDGAVWCWGGNAHGQLGNGDSTASTIPARVPLAAAALSIGAGATHACAVVEGARVFCWGAGDDGQLGNPRLAASRTPVEAGLVRRRE